MACLCGDPTVLSPTLNCDLESLYSGLGVTICRPRWLLTGLLILAMAPILFNYSQGRNINRRQVTQTLRKQGAEKGSRSMSQGPLATEEETRLEPSKLGHEMSRQWKCPPLQGPKGEAQGGECGGSLGGKTGSQSSQPGEGGN